MEGAGTANFQSWLVHFHNSTIGSNSRFGIRCITNFAFFSAFLLCVVREEVAGARQLRERRLDEAESRIVGGIEATRNYPYTTALYGSNPAIGSICGGMLILPDVVMTAAHCTGFIHVVRTNLHSKYDDTGEQFDVDRQATRNHPEYSGNHHDVALLKLKGASTVKPILLNGIENDPVAGSAVRVMGWGRLSSGGSAATNLQQVDVNVISNTQCNEMYSGMITDDMICAMVEGGGKDACQGDSGGPLIVANDAIPDEDLLVGVVSWGYGCAGPNHPGVYSRISNQIEWIQENACEMTDLDLSNTGCPLRVRSDVSMPTSPVASPFVAPIDPPTNAPIDPPTKAPIDPPTKAPIDPPAKAPVDPSTMAPIDPPTVALLNSPVPSVNPTDSRTLSPSHSPSFGPTFFPTTSEPTVSTRPSTSPSFAPTPNPTKQPTSDPSAAPTSSPSYFPSTVPTISVVPSIFPSERPSISPTISAAPTTVPSSPPSANPSVMPSDLPTISFVPTDSPTMQPTSSPTQSFVPSPRPTTSPTAAPTAAPVETTSPVSEAVRTMSQYERDCVDINDTFVGPSDTVRDCEWVNQYRFGRCQYYCGLCPITCFDGQKDACLSRSRTCKGDYGF